ncbi:MAG: hypothetical protein CVV27_03020 [Candidatus Melainabacteria bacterium HGW-Melainabacteria-1]|nr:MAG: hypothetical protein CVV27_03020 [Candidatus Melainabacteria bacterium HGW-Melainabacteria-1]
MLHLLLLGACVLSALPGCAEGIVLNPAQSFGQSSIELPSPDPSPMPSPSTPVEKLQVQLIEIKDKASAYGQQYGGLAWPLVFGLFLLWAFWQLLRWIYELTTSSPSLF